VQSLKTKPAFAELSPDLQWKIAAARQLMEFGVQWCLFAITASAVTLMVYPPANQAMDTALHEGYEVKIWKFTLFKIDPALETLGIIPPENLRPIEKGDTIAGFTVNSGYGDRWHPIWQEYRFHSGVDLPTETGTKIFAPGNRRSRVKVTCLDPWASGGGGLTAVMDSPDIPDRKFYAMHLSKCATGLHPGGSVIGETGGDPSDPNAGTSTGPHLHWTEKHWNGEDWVTVHPVKAYLQWSLTGQAPRTMEQVEVGAVPFQSLFSGEQLKCLIGAPEGTRNPTDCTPTSAYFGHSDPGNGVWNMGSFSYQHGAASPEEADEKWLPKLLGFQESLQQDAIGKFGAELSASALAGGVDLFNQAPLAGQDYLKFLDTPDPTPQEIIDARVQAFYEPSTGRLDAPGFGNSLPALTDDQERRTNSTQKALESLQ
jgi:hypothetical protein